MTGLSPRGAIQGQDLWLVDPASGELVWTGLRPRCLDQIHEAGVQYRLPPPPRDADRLLRTNGHVVEAARS